MTIPRSAQTQCRKATRLWRVSHLCFGRIAEGSHRQRSRGARASHAARFGNDRTCALVPGRAAFLLITPCGSMTAAIAAEIGVGAAESAIARAIAG